MKRRSRRTATQSSYVNSSSESKRKDELEMDLNETAPSPTPQPSPVVKASEQLKKKRGTILRRKKKKAGKTKVRFALSMNKIYNDSFENDIEEASQMNEIESNFYGNDIEASLNEIENHSSSNINDIDDAIEEQDIQTSLIVELAHTIRNQNYSIIDNLPFALSQQEFKRSSIIDDITYRIERSEIQSKYLEKCFFVDKSKTGVKDEKETSNINRGIKQKGDFVTSTIDYALEASELQDTDEWTFQKSAGHGSFLAMSINFALDRNRALQKFFDSDMEHLFKKASGESERTWKLY